MTFAVKFGRHHLSMAPEAQGAGTVAEAFRKYAAAVSWLTPAACRAAGMPLEPWLSPSASPSASIRLFLYGATERAFERGRFVLRGVPMAFRLRGSEEWLVKPQYRGNVEDHAFYAGLYT